MAHRSYRAESRSDWGTNDGGGLDRGQIELGCMLRIADATEVMSRSFTQLLADIKYLRERNVTLTDDNEHLKRRIGALKGQITRLKRTGVPAEPGAGDVAA